MTYAATIALAPTARPGNYLGLLLTQKKKKGGMGMVEREKKHILRLLESLIPCMNFILDTNVL
jgi:hypothetical protein